MLVAWDYIPLFLGIFMGIVILLPWWALIIPLHREDKLSRGLSKRERIKWAFQKIPIKVLLLTLPLINVINRPLRDLYYFGLGLH